MKQIVFTVTALFLAVLGTSRLQAQNTPPIPANADLIRTHMAKRIDAYYKSISPGRMSTLKTLGFESSRVAIYGWVKVHPVKQQQYHTSTGKRKLVISQINYAFFRYYFISGKIEGDTIVKLHNPFWDVRVNLQYLKSVITGGDIPPYFRALIAENSIMKNKKETFTNDE